MTRQEKRAETLRKKYGENWQKILAEKSMKVRVANNGMETYVTMGRKGGLNVPSEKRAYSVNHELAKQAGKKGAEKRWGKNDSQM